MGTNIKSSGNTVSMDQKKYINELLEEFGLSNEPNSTVTTPMAEVASTDNTPLDDQQASTYRTMVGCLVYIATMTRPDIAYSVSCVSRHLHAPAVHDRKAVKRVYRYLRYTVDESLVYSSPDVTIEVMSDSNSSNCKETSSKAPPATTQSSANERGPGQMPEASRPKVLPQAAGIQQEPGMHVGRAVSRGTDASGQS